MNIDALDKKLVRRIAEGLVRLDDVYHDRKVYGGISQEQRLNIKSTINQAINSGIAYEDIVESIVEYSKQIMEIGPIGPVTAMSKPGQPPKPAGTAVQTTQAVSEPDSAAKVSIGTKTNQFTANSQQATTPTQDMATTKKDIETLLRDPKFGTEFAELLARAGISKR